MMAPPYWTTLAQLYFDGAWQHVRDAVASNPGVATERGVADDLDPKPGSCTFRLLDPADRYRPSNAASPLYGQTGPYMPGAYATGLGGGPAGRVWFTGESQSMTPSQSDDHHELEGATVRGNRWVDVRLSGPLGRVGRWRDPLASPLRTQILRYGTNLRGYWPLEDGKDATRLANLTDATNPGSIAGSVRVGSADAPAGSAPVLELTGSSTVTLYIGPMSDTGGWQLSFAVKVVNATDTLTDVAVWRTSAGHTWRWRASKGLYSIRVEDVRGGVLLDYPVNAAGTDAMVGQWVYHRIKVSAAGSTVTVEPSWYAENGTGFWGFTATYNGTMGAPTMLTFVSNAVTLNAAYAHAFVIAGTALNLETYDMINSFNGYAGETTAARFARLCSSVGLPYVIRGDTTKARRMGPQPIGTVQDQLKQIRATEAGLIFDRAEDIGIVFALADHLTTQAAAPVLTLRWPDDIAPPLTEASDAATLYNLITVKNLNGSSALAVLETGRQGTANPPAGSGRLDKTVEVNLYDEAELPSVAGWWLAYYTQPGPRFDSIAIDLDAHPELLTAANASDVGAFIKVVGRTPDPLLLLITSVATKGHRKRHVVTYTVAPGGIFNVGVYGSAAARYDSASTTLAAAADATTPTLQVSTRVAEETWSTTDTPYDWVIAGERVTVTAITAPTGAGPWTQTATVARAANGVRKAQAAGAVVSLADPVYYGF